VVFLIQKCIKVNWFQLWTIVLLFGGLLAIHETWYYS